MIVEAQKKNKKTLECYFMPNKWDVHKKERETKK